jgi:hypothetical protein
MGERITNKHQVHVCETDQHRITVTPNTSFMTSILITMWGDCSIAGDYGTKCIYAIVRPK